MAFADSIVELLAHIQIGVFLGALEELFHLEGARTLLDEVTVLDLALGAVEQTDYASAHGMTHGRPGCHARSMGGHILDGATSASHHRVLLGGLYHREITGGVRLGRSALVSAWHSPRLLVLWLPNVGMYWA